MDVHDVANVGVSDRDRIFAPRDKNMTREQDLQDMARVAISAKQAGDPRYAALVMALANRLKMQPAQVEQSILMLMVQPL